MGLPVKLKNVIEAIDVQTDEAGAYLNRRTGEVIVIAEEELNAAENRDPLEDFPEWQRDTIKMARELIDREEDFLSLPTKYEVHEYSIMEDFCRSVRNRETSEALFTAIQGKGAFRRFKDTLERYGHRDEWYAYRDRALRQIAVDWCKEHDIAYSDD